MDKTPLTILIIIIAIMGVVTGLTFYNISNTNLGINKTVINNDNESGMNNTSSKTGSNNPSFLSQSAHGTSESHFNPQPSPGPNPDPMRKVISLLDAYVNTIFPQSGIPGTALVIVQNDKVIYKNVWGLGM